MTTNPFSTLDFRQEGLTPLATIYRICQGGFSSDELKRHYATPNFTWRELFVHRSSKELMWITKEHLVNLQRLAWKLEGVRTLFKHEDTNQPLPIQITSGWRDIVGNRRVGGAKASRHLAGEGVDIKIVKERRGKETIYVPPSIVQRTLDPIWEGGLGYGATFTHLDTRPWKARFGY